MKESFMRETSPNPLQAIFAANPFLVFWSLPYVMGQAWMAAWLSAGVRKDAVERNQDPGQIPIPPELQDSQDKELFA